MKIKFYIVLLFTTSLFAQKVTTSIDSTKKKIGAEFKLTIKTEVDTLSKVTFPKATNFGSLEVIQSYKIDTIKKGNRYELIKKYGLTQFDSGHYVIPRMPILINGKPSYSDSIKVEVNDVKVDTLKQKMFDIKDIASEKTESNWWKYLLGLLVLGLVGYGLFHFLKNRPKKEKPVVIEYKTPIEKATSLLQQLEQKELWQKGEVKSYYSELTDIARNYIEEEIHIPAMESTTSELIEALRRAAKQKKLKLSNEIVVNLEKVLKQADLVKFAKSKPLDFEIEEDKKRIANSIVTIHNSIPVIVEKKNELDLWNEQQKEKARLEQLRKEKNKKRMLIAGIAFGLLVIVFGFFVATKGFDWTKDKILGNETRELFEDEWIYSEYGNPGIKIETPKVLQRLDVKKSKLFKEMQLFSYGNLADDFYVGLGTFKFKQNSSNGEQSKQTKVDLDKAIDEAITQLEKEGASNIFVKSEDYDTQNGVTGKKAYGTLVAKEGGDLHRMYYEILFFSQDDGLQKIMIAYKENDQFGKEIMERILNSVELKTTQ
jgi:hypothetical protein